MTTAAWLRPTDDPFYADVPDLAGPPGRLLRQRSVAVATLEGVDAWHVVHSSTSTEGRTIAVSGTVLRPRLPWEQLGQRPILAYGVGAHGLGRDGAPSHLLVTGREAELALLATALRVGWTVTVTDGQGLGMAGPHTYGSGPVGGHCVLDLVRASMQLPGVASAAPVLLWGYSEGGRCVAAAADLQPRYAPDLDVRAVAAGGVPADLHTVVRAIDGGPFSGLGLAVLVGLAHAHRDGRLWDILSKTGLTAARHAARLDVAGLITGHPEPMRSHTVRDHPWDEPVWRAVLRRECSPFGRPDVPVYLYHAEFDEVVPVQVARGLADAYCAMGVPVTFAALPGIGHLAGAAQGARGAIVWLLRQLADQAATGSGTRTQTPVAQEEHAQTRPLTTPRGQCPSPARPAEQSPR